MNELFQMRLLCRNRNAQPIPNVKMINLALINVAETLAPFLILVVRMPIVILRDTVPPAFVQTVGVEILKFSVINVSAIFSLQHIL